MRQEDVQDVVLNYDGLDVQGFLDDLLDWRNNSGTGDFERYILDVVFDEFVNYLY